MKKLPKNFGKMKGESTQSQCAVKNCKQKIIGSYSPDMDVRGIGFCRKHKTLVFGAYCMLISGDTKGYESLTGVKII